MDLFKDDVRKKKSPLCRRGLGIGLYKIYKTGLAY